MAFCGTDEADAAALASPLLCAQPVAPTTAITASDALLVLRTAVALDQCFACVCDADGSGQVTASDALLTLRKAVGLSGALACPPCCEHCGECMAGLLPLTLAEVQPCTGCIPRVPTNGDVGSITLTFKEDLNSAHELTYIGDCTWQKTLPAAIAEKVLYGGDVTDCTGTSQSSSDIDVSIRVVRTADSWETYVGMYAVSLGWGDVVRATIDAAACDSGGNTASENATCALAGSNDPDQYDIHATGGTVTLDVPPVCP